MGGGGGGEDGVPNRGGEEKAAVQIKFILLGVFPDGFHSSLPEPVGSSLTRLHIKKHLILHLTCLLLFWVVLISTSNRSYSESSLV